MRCLQCGKEIPEGRKFCSSSCSAKYNNVRRQRKPWTEEQRQKNVEMKSLRKVEKGKTCKYCGKEIRGKSTICNECKPFVERLQTFQKLGLLEGSLVLRNSRAKEIVKTLYEEGLSIADMYRQFSLHNVTVRRMLKEQGVELRSLSEEQKRVLEKGRKCSAGIRGTHRTWQGVEVDYRSTWEDRYMSLLDDQQVEYLYEPFRIRYWDSEAQQERVAIPDFYLPKTREIVELKSSWTFRGREQQMRDKFTVYRNLGYSPKLLLDWKFVEL